MANILVTGASGNLGYELVEKLLVQGHQVSGLARHWENHAPIKSYCSQMFGDITEEGLGIGDADWKFDAVYHLAGILNLSAVDKGNLIQNTNIFGTANVIKFCLKYKVPHLYHCSTAYMAGRNPYEISKQAAEMLVQNSTIPQVTIFKPSLVLGCENQHFSTFVSLLIFLHRRMELIRRRVEGTLRLPVIIEPCFRVHGNPDGLLNLITVDAVATAMSEIKASGTFWLTNSNPPKLSELAEIVGRFCLINLSFTEKFTATPIEAAFHKLSKAFQPYLEGDYLPSDLPSFKLQREDIDKELVKLIH